MTSEENETIVRRAAGILETFSIATLGKARPGRCERMRRFLSVRIANSARQVDECLCQGRVAKHITMLQQLVRNYPLAAEQDFVRHLADQ